MADEDIEIISPPTHRRHKKRLPRLFPAICAVPPKLEGFGVKAVQATLEITQPIAHTITLVCEQASAGPHYWGCVFRLPEGLVPDAQLATVKAVLRFRAFKNQAASQEVGEASKVRVRFTTGAKKVAPKDRFKLVILGSVDYPEDNHDILGEERDAFFCYGALEGTDSPSDLKLTANDNSTVVRDGELFPTPGESWWGVLFDLCTKFDNRPRAATLSVQIGSPISRSATVCDI